MSVQSNIWNNGISGSENKINLMLCNLPLFDYLFFVGLSGSFEIPSLKELNIDIITVCSVSMT